MQDLNTLVAAFYVYFIIHAGCKFKDTWRSLEHDLSKYKMFRPKIFRFSGKKYNFYAFCKAKCLSKCIKLYYFSRKPEKNLGFTSKSR